MIRDVLLHHFCDPNNVESPDLKRFVWLETPKTGILIESIHKWRGELVEKRPAVIIKENGSKNLRQLRNDIAGETEQGHVNYATYWVGSHTLFCLHGSGASAGLLGTEVQRLFTQNADELVKHLGLHQWAVTERSGISEIEESKEGFAVAVTIGWAYEEAWRLELESLKLRKVPLSVSLDGTLVQQTT